MARIEQRKGRKGGGYERLFGDEDVGHLISRVQGAVISAGTELERIIRHKASPIKDFDSFLQQGTFSEGTFLATKSQLKKSNILDFSGQEPDFAVFRISNGQRRCYIVEVKDGDNFDTKKAATEHRLVHEYITQNAHLIDFEISAHICSFNQLDKQEIVIGFKEMISAQEALTGPEFCAMLEIDYEEIIEERKSDQQPNLEYLISELCKIRTARELIKQNMEIPLEEQVGLFE